MTPWQLIAALILLGLATLLIVRTPELLRRRRVYAGWRKPRRFDRNILVIGAGAAGLVSAYMGATLRAKVTLVEKHLMGGDCLNTGCVPSKALLRSSRFIAQARRANELGLDACRVDFDFKQLMQRVQQVVKAIEPHDSVERYTRLGVEVIQGKARLLSPWSVEINTDEGLAQLTASHIIIASGARPFVPPIPGLKDIQPLTSDNLWQVDTLPKRLLVLGGGPIGCELAQAFACLGSRVLQVEQLPNILQREDPEVSELVSARMQRDGVEILCNTKAVRCFMRDGEKILLAERNGESLELAFDQILVAVGRRARTDGLGLEPLGIAVEANGRLKTNAYLQTDYPNIFACGDVASPYQFTHSAAHQAWHAVVNALFGGLRRFAVDYSHLPMTTFCEPEVSRVGLNEQQAREKGIDVEVTRFEFSELDRAIADSATEGFVKVLTPPGKDRILGVCIVGEQAGELIAEYVLAMRHGLGLNKVLSSIHAYPTLAEANKYAAGIWKRNHAPQAILALLARYHRRRLKH